jgi:hypothetical protein
MPRRLCEFGLVLVLMCIAVGLALCAAPGAAMSFGAIATPAGAVASAMPTVERGSAANVAARQPVGAAPPIDLVEPRPAVPPPDATVVLYGDSLAAEAESFFVERLRAGGVADVRTRTFGGTAICDWLDTMRRDAADLHPDVVVVEFSGNALTPCMMREDGASLAIDHDALHAKYLVDAQEVARIFAADRTEVYFVGAPRGRAAEARNEPDIDWFNSMYQAIAAAVPNAAYIDAGATVLSNGRWTETLPCLPSEPCTGPAGSNVVRAPDGAHFCPGAAEAVRGVTMVCNVWSSGAYRYGSAIAEGVLAGPTSFRLG